MKQHNPKTPRVPKVFRPYYKGFDETVKFSGRYGAHVFEFENDEQLMRFLTEVGGATHPLGGHRAILWR